MRGDGVCGKSPRRWQSTTIPDPAAPTRPDLVQRDFVVNPGGDRYPLVRRHHLHQHLGGLAVSGHLIDLASRRVVGWAVAEHLKTDLVDAALTDALRRRPAGGLVFHSDCSFGHDRSRGGRWPRRQTWHGRNAPATPARTPLQVDQPTRVCPDKSSSGCH